ncbi:polysaccharide biosynthesis/export family protein [Bradyrhizobium sp. CB3481]|uniref:polysaccharide biosynthesis/export family protein n=1 Tax=Bradyrhizobium sp. CB3481 TaxID=3039158 RepID=UPI0024B0DFAF|nr:polysaccharide biosynthesis/export family protein [Bradyrhizobium sp. CB3481]WFU20745.1 polysaccharide export protein [Bradyrhizobium sp. CB3481]
MRAFRIAIIAIITALALSGCMRTTGPVAVAPQGDLDSMAYGQPGSPPPQAVAAGSGGGAVGALRAAFAAPRPAPIPVVVAAPAAYVEPAPVRHDATYHLDAGDKLRVVVYGQEGLTNTYAVSAGGSITMPLIGSVMARGRTTAGLAAEISAKLRAGFIREPSVAVEIEAYRPFFILGEVAAPGQYPYVPNMTAESAVAIAGGFSPRARRDSVTVTHTDGSGTSRFVVSPASPISPGDTVLVGERWF